MKKFTLSLFFIVTCWFFLNSCTKNVDQAVQRPAEQVIDGFKAWVQDNYTGKDKINWSKANASQSGDQLTIPIEWKITNQAGIPSFRRMVITKHSNGTYSGIILEVAHKIDTSLERSLRYKKENFTGTVITYDLQMNFVRGGYFEKNTYKAPVALKKFLTVRAFQEWSLSRLTCSWVQSSYVGDDGIFTVVNTKECIDVPDPGTGGGNGGDGDIPHDNPYDPEYEGPTDPGQQPELDPEAAFGVDCSSFSFVKTSNYWQEAGVNRIRLRWMWISPGGSIMREVWIDNTIFGLPTQYATGPVITPGAAGTLAAYAIDRAKYAIYDRFKETPTIAADHIVTAAFNEQMALEMLKIGGTAGKTGSGSPAIIRKNEERSSWLSKTCD